MRETPEIIVDLANAAFEDAMAAIVRKTRLVSHPDDKITLVVAALMQMAAKHTVLIEQVNGPLVDRLKASMTALVAVERASFAREQGKG